MKAILRRTKLQQEEQVAEAPDEDSILIAELKILPEFYEAYFQGRKLELTPKEFELLVYLAKIRARIDA